MVKTRLFDTGRSLPVRVAARTGAVLLAASILSWGVAASALASGSRTVLPRSPLSARIPSARVTGPGGAGTSSSYGSQSPGITVLPNVVADGTTANPVDEDPLTADPVTSTHLMSGGNDYSCSSLQGFYNSDDSGGTWRHHCIPVLHGGCGDPAVAYDRNGVGYVAGIDCGSVWNIVLQSTPDNGLTWGAAHDVVSSIQGGLTDKEWMEVDTSATSPHVNCIYISLTDFNSSATASRITVSHSCNGGSSFTTVPVDSLQSLPSLDQFSDLTVGNDGTVWVSWMRCHTSGTAGDCAGTSVTEYNSKSTDGGATWSTPTKIADVTLAPDTCGGYYGCFPGSSERLSNIPVIDHDASTGKLWATFYNYSGGATHAELTSSSDGGVTWTTPAVINPSGSAGWMWTSTNDAGRIAVSFMFSQSSGSYFAAAVVTMNGTTFLKKKTSTGGAMLFSNDGFGGGFIGDYTGGIWTGNTYHQSWMDTRSGGVSSDMTGGVAT
jgi:hypothetical protein